MSKGASAEELRTQLQAIDPYEFEDFVGELWEAEGWDTTVSQGSNDMGVDVIAEQSGAIDQKAVIQAKRYSDGNKVGRPKIQQYHSLKEQDTDADAAVVVTTSEFTDKARLWAHDHNVKLVDGDDLAEMVRKHEMKDRAREYAVDGTGSESTSSDSESSSSTSSPSASVSVGAAQKTGLTLYGVLAGYGVGTLGMFAPGTLPIGSNVAAWVFAIALLATPVVVFADTVALSQRHDRSYKLRWLIWPIGAVMLGPFTLLAYLLLRS